MKININIKRQAGLTLMEFMIGTALSLLILLSLAELFNNHRLTYLLQHGLSRIQENGRFAQYIISKNVRMAGYQGCDASGGVTPNIIADPMPVNFDISTTGNIQGYNSNSSTWSPALPTAIEDSVVTGTDVISISFMEGTPDLSTTKMAVATSNITVNGRANIEANDIVMVTDCEYADIFRATAVSDSTGISHSDSGNTTASLSQAYQANAIVGKLALETFYIKDSGRTNAQGNAIFSLFSIDIDGNESELAEGIEDMQITYGRDTDGDFVADTYETADAIDTANNWSQVKTIKISLLVNSVEEVALIPQNYYYNGVSNITPTDKKLRKHWDIFITVRNKQLGL